MWRHGAFSGWSQIGIRQQVMEHPYVADAKIAIHWPGRVVVSVQEASPVAVWVTDGGELWLLPDGTALGSRAATNPDLVRIIDGPQSARSPYPPVADSGIRFDLRCWKPL